MAEAGREIALRLGTAFKNDRLSDGALKTLNRTSSTGLILGTPPSEFDSEELLLVTVQPDDSTSQNRVVKRKPNVPAAPFSYRPMLEGEASRSSSTDLANYEITYVEADHPESNAEATRIGHNHVIDALFASPHPDSVLFATRYLNGQLLNPYGPLSMAQRLTTRNFTPNRGTPLYDQTVETLKMVLAKYEQVRADWREARTATLLVTDGLDEHSRIQNAASVAEVIRSMRDTGHHIIAAMGISDGSTDFRRVFIAMGIDPNWILTTGSTKEDILKAFGLFAEKASEATRPENFTALLTSGFGSLTKT